MAKKERKKSNIKYLFKEWVSVSKKSFFQVMVRIPIELLLPTLMAFIPKLIIDAINTGVADTTMLILVGCLTFCLVFLSVIQPYFYGKMNKAAFEYDLHFSMIGLKKMLNINYQKLESFEGRRQYERARSFCGLDKNSMLSASEFVYTTSSILISVSGIFSYIILFSVLQPYLVFIIIFSSIIEFFMLKGMNNNGLKFRDEMSPFFTKFNYFYKTATESKCGKDIRLYGLGDWFCMLLARLSAGVLKIYNNLFKKNLKFTFGQATAVLIRDIASYAFLISYAIIGKMTLANFILYFGLLVGFSSWITGLSYSVNRIGQINDECSRFREFMDSGDDSQDSQLPFSGKVESLEFRNVSFAYNDSQNPVLKNINFKLTNNDRIAIVGENGAGKTTLIKIMCGLYRPTSGEILVNGVNVIDSIGKNYFDLFATVFQDFYFLPLTVLENISTQTIDKSDKKLAEDCLRKAGLLNKVEGLPNGIMSKMVKEVWEEAVEFSGGEQQRLLLARALYKNASIIILDEPTSALDPIAEQNIYSCYKEFSEDKISIFISHRLASTQFCSKVFYLSNGEIVESGSHDELLKLEGKYWSMFEAQSYYYNHPICEGKGGQNE